MYFAMNRFRVHAGQEEAFEALWRERTTRLGEVDGFVSFRVLRGAFDPGTSTRLYISHSTWRDQSAFADWTRSQAFRAAHSNVGDARGIYAGPPVFEGFETVDGVA
jgi:heme-degrading monooxygenase HmoA